MSKIAILSDIHGNLPAFEAVLRDVVDTGAEGIAFGGDIVGYGASPAECVALVRKLGGNCVLGNHDAFTRIVAAEGMPKPKGWNSGVWAGVEHAVREMDEGALGWLWDLPLRMRIEGAVVAHSELSAPAKWKYLHDRADAKPTLAILREKGLGVGFFGHTHRQDHFYDPDAPEVPENLGGGRIIIPEGAACAVTVGSVGQSREGADLRAGWALWDPDERLLEFRRTEYPAAEAAKAILEAGLPEESAYRLLDDDGMDDLFYSGVDL